MGNYSVVIKSILSEPSIEEWNELSNGLPNDLIDKANHFKNWKQRALRLRGWQLLLAELNKLQCPELINNISYGDKGKPFFENGNIFFNISNTKNTVILVVSNAEIGVDLEFSRSPKKNIYSRVFCSEEIAFLEASTNETYEFIRLWTRKESVVKLFGGGISMGLSNFSVLKNELFAFDKIVQIEKFEIEGGIAHIAFFQSYNHK
jgi:phosphopantetheinyl transferase